jgi:hypothetical protein
LKQPHHAQPTAAEHEPAAGGHGAAAVSVGLSELHVDPLMFHDDVRPSAASVTSGVAPTTLVLTHAFGYAARRLSNVHALSETTCAFISGNVLQVLDTVTGQQTYRRSVLGGGLGAIAVHPSFSHVAVAENGSAPAIFVFALPEWRVYRVLTQGATRGYASVAFNASGTKLASVATGPDYTLVVWDWRNETPILQTKVCGVGVCVYMCFCVFVFFVFCFFGNCFIGSRK